MLNMICTVCYVVSFLFVVLFKMVAQKITCPSRSDDIGNQYIYSDTKRYGFFANESQDSQSFESGRHRSFKVKQGSAGERHNRSDYRRKHRTVAIFAGANHQLFRGKADVGFCEYLNVIFILYL